MLAASEVALAVAAAVFLAAVPVALVLLLAGPVFFLAAVLVVFAVRLAEALAVLAV